MRKTALFIGLFIGGLLLAACGDGPPPTQIVVVTATPLPGPVVSVEAGTPASSPSDSPDTDTPEPSDTPPDPTDTTAPRVTDTVRPDTVRPDKTITPDATATPIVFNPLMPTNVYAEAQIAEQGFEHGRMIWLRHNQQIWVTIQSEDDPKRGDWYCYNDSYEEGEPEIDPDLIPPEGLVQPRRGFGKLWRTNEDLRESLGWATTTEFELTSPYTYIAGGMADANGELPPGEYRLTSLYNETLIFYEQETRGDCMGGLWRIGQ
ncbi:MAG: hypothetical protein JXA10_02400 [Anaerolineae bacterium]|nr:hypothetical protein [Anaerolineae bacterium]